MIIKWFNLNRIGLIYDIIGAFLVVYSQVRIGSRDIKEADLVWRDEINRRNLKLAKHDSISGFSLLLIGFLLQLLGSDQFIANQFYCLGILGPIASAALLIIAIILYSVKRTRIFSEFYESIKGEDRKKHT